MGRKKKHMEYQIWRHLQVQILKPYNYSWEQTPGKDAFPVLLCHRGDCWRQANEPRGLLVWPRAAFPKFTRAGNLWRAFLKGSERQMHLPSAVQSAFPVSSGCSPVRLRATVKIDRPVPASILVLLFGDPQTQTMALLHTTQRALLCSSM